ncbi:hypothetical protein MUP79_05550 [Candidatus Bathyarchaeota archaeon]|nr:hypothetical protein [Candidatus Bathyarchaeota archaeon]
MSNRRHAYDIEAQHIQTLGQKLVSKRPELKDYACNVYADKIAALDIAIQENKKDPDISEILNRLRTQLLRKGEAIWIMKADVLTNLGLKVGRTGVREYHGKPGDPDSDADI